MVVCSACWFFPGGSTTTSAFSRPQVVECGGAVASSTGGTTPVPCALAKQQRGRAVVGAVLALVLGAAAGRRSSRRRWGTRTSARPAIAKALASSAGGADRDDGSVGDVGEPRAVGEERGVGARCASFQWGRRERQQRDSEPAQPQQGRGALADASGGDRAVGAEREHGSRWPGCIPSRSGFEDGFEQRSSAKFREPAHGSVIRCRSVCATVSSTPSERTPSHRHGRGGGGTGHRHRPHHTAVIATSSSSGQPKNAFSSVAFIDSPAADPGSPARDWVGKRVKA